MNFSQIWRPNDPIVATYPNHSLSAAPSLPPGWAPPLRPAPEPPQCGPAAWPGSRPSWSRGGSVTIMDWTLPPTQLRGRPGAASPTSQLWGTDRQQQWAQSQESRSQPVHPSMPQPTASGNPTLSAQGMDRIVLISVEICWVAGPRQLTQTTAPTRATTAATTRAWPEPPPWALPRPTAATTAGARWRGPRTTDPRLRGTDHPGKAEPAFLAPTGAQ